MKNSLKTLALAAAMLTMGNAAWAKLPAPVLTDEAKAKAAEATAKTAWSGKVAGYQLCKSQDKAASRFYGTAKAAGKSVNAPTATPPCADPGAFAYTPVAAPAPAAEVKKP
ncbi:hypothetical protein [Rhodoferax sp. PAMC 29310]|uniref:hypothetical protein n=1 Tax=Rhodoferax sp. PAMC 29310 TaxID=2822760 RepID=UPI001B31E435|nr:hypothetical protein [Rhodoferax sp. PAMC 29310]